MFPLQTVKISNFDKFAHKLKFICRSRSFFAGAGGFFAGAGAGAGGEKTEVCTAVGDFALVISVLH